MVFEPQENRLTMGYKKGVRFVFSLIQFSGLGVPQQRIRRQPHTEERIRIPSRE